MIKELLISEIQNQLPENLSLSTVNLDDNRAEFIFTNQATKLWFDLVGLDPKIKTIEHGSKIFQQKKFYQDVLELGKHRALHLKLAVDNDGTGFVAAVGEGIRENETIKTQMGDIEDNKLIGSFSDTPAAPEKIANFALTYSRPVKATRKAKL